MATYRLCICGGEIELHGNGFKEPEWEFDLTSQTNSRELAKQEAQEIADKTKCDVGIYYNRMADMGLLERIKPHV